MEATRGKRPGGGPNLAVSFEFFPPKTAEMEASLWKAVERLAPLCPHFVSVTYGAGGSTRDRTHQIVARIARETDLRPAAHLTCVDASREEIEEVIYAYWDAGVRHIVALRGDPAEGVGARYRPHPHGFQTTAELVEGIRRIGNFEISVSAYPEKHPESPDFDTDIDVLAAKVDAGATRAITQFFFDNAYFYRYRDRLAARGIDIPVVPGILPISNFAQAARFAERCGTHIPESFAARFEGLDQDPETRLLVAASVVAEQVLDLLDNGVSDFHFYTLNRAELVYAACHMLGLRPALTTSAAA
ncbi:5,10-methylenetetrahydrofolate reductase (NAD(P)) [Tepidamorphus gemmatus]|uniref:Methylenetetrahydrofolate reductase n=1 Tax=Tepidamorphus gemmatus TaxID=747076 RepID=A0A4R3MAC8_9HYPH|nr:methylenetetrahydrofolate reductase [NAD(P)H] [Tepidamorphus gemmatus]TCT08365.1 5,10-methylenetetrahydrofolate reductase (NAD(P)) [Tepidamorphus gemmatus]